MNNQLFRQASDLSLRIDALTQTIQALKLVHKNAYYIQKEHKWRCPGCGKTARTAPNLTKKLCRKK